MGTTLLTWAILLLVETTGLLPKNRAGETWAGWACPAPGPFGGTLTDSPTDNFLLGVFRCGLCGESVPSLSAVRRVVQRWWSPRSVVVVILSPGNKASTSALRRFVVKSSDLIMQEIHLLVIDRFPPGKRDPQSIPKAMWDQIKEDDFELPASKPLTLASSDAGPPPVAWIDPIATDDALPDLPLFLKPEFDVPAPLETTYQETWSRFPAPMKRLLEPPAGNPRAS